MKRLNGRAWLVGLLAVSIAGTVLGDKIKWARSYDAALKEAKRTNKPIMLDFYADESDLCKRLDRDTYTDKRVIQLAGQFVPVKLNGEKEGASAAKKYRVSGYPTILFLNPAGEVIGQIGGYLGPTDFSVQMSRALEAYRNFPNMQEQLKKNPNDVEACAKLAVIYAARGDVSRASDLLARAEKGDPQNRSGFLGRAWNAVGDYYQIAGNYDRAIPLFRKAVQRGKNPSEVVYARLSIAVCYMSKGEQKKAIPELEAILKMKNAPKENKALAKELLDEARQNR